MQAGTPGPGHGRPQLLRSDVGRVHVGHEPPSQDHLDGVGQADQLVQVGRDQQHGQARAGGLPGCGPRSRPGRRRRHRASGARRSAPSAHRSSRGRRSASAGCHRTATTASTSMPGVRTSYWSMIRWVSLRAPRAVDPRALDVGRLGLVAEDPVLPQRRRRAAGRAGAGPRGCSRCRAPGGAGWARCEMSSPPRSMVPGRQRAHPHDRLDQLGLAVALDAGDAEHLAAVDREGQVLDQRPGRRPTGRSGPRACSTVCVGDRRLPGLRGGQLAADHQLGELPGGDARPARRSRPWCRAG